MRREGAMDCKLHCPKKGYRLVLPIVSLKLIMILGYTMQCSNRAQNFSINDPNLNKGFILFILIGGKLNHRPNILKVIYHV